MRNWQRRVGVIAAGAVFGVAMWSTASAVRATQAPPGATPSPAAPNQGIYYRPLTSFSRGGRTTAVVGVPSNPQVYYFGACGGGVWKTTDAGVTWEPLTDGQINVGSIGAVAVADSNPDIIYIGTGSADPRGNVTNGDGVYKSINAGKTWTHIGLEKAGLIGKIRIDPTNPDVAYVAALGNIFGPNPERGVYRTKDGGKTWDQVLKVSDKTGAIEISMDPKTPTTLFASMWTTVRQPWTIDSGSMNDGIFRSTDGGDHWTKMTNGLPTGVMVGKSSVSISPANPKRVFALIEAANDQGGVYRSDDGGDSWSRTYAGRNLLQRAFYYVHVVADPVDADTVYAINTSLFKSTDGGKTFQTVQTPHSDNHDVWINPKNNKALINGNDGGANISLDGGRTWSTQENQPTAEIYRIETDNRWPYWVYGAQQDNSSVGVPSNNVGDAMLDAGPGEAGYLAVDPRNPNVIYAGNYGGFLQRSDRTSGVSDNIRVYDDIETGQRAADMKYRFQWNAPMRLSPHNPDVVYTTSQYVLRSKDDGQNWERISPDLTRNDKSKQDYAGVKGVTRDDTGAEVYDTIFAFEESPVTAGLLWAGSDDGLLNISKDAGKSWEAITPPGLPAWSTINVIDLSPKNAAHAIVTAYRYMLNDYTPYVYETNDYGKTWKRIADGTNGIPADHPTRVVREDPDQPGVLFAGTEYGIYISYDDGGHWQRFQLNLPATPIMDLKIYRHNLIVATEGRGFWILDELPAVDQMKPATATQPATLFKPTDAYRQGGTLPTFYYWFKDTPTAPVKVEVLDSTGSVVYTATGEPGQGAIAPPSMVPTRAGGAGRGRGAGGGGGGRGNFGPGAGATASAVAGLNRATWTPRLPSPFTVPPRIIMWGAGGGGSIKAATGVYTVRVTSGVWSQSQSFHLGSDPRITPAMTDADGAAQVKMALEVGGWAKTLYDNLAKIRSAKQQAADFAKSTPALASAAKTLTDNLVKVEGELTQLQGEAGQDSLNFPGRLDNQVVGLFSNITGLERKLNTAVTERYADLKPQYDDLMKRATAALASDVPAFNAAAAKAGVTPGIVIK